MTFDIIDYGKLVDDAMHIIVSKVLNIVKEKGLPGNHHFFISFMTKYPGVKISKTLLNKYPREMTVVLQYQFQDLTTDSKGFGVSLSFNGIKESIYIPYAAITTFADPSVQFGLQFREVGYSFNDQEELELEVELEKNPTDPSSKDKKPAKKGAKKADPKDPSTNVISLDQFRNKK
jgi:uncharacterized protein